MKQQVMEPEPSVTVDTHAHVPPAALGPSGSSSAEIEESGEVMAALSAFAAPRGFLPPYWRPVSNGGGSNGGGAPVGGSAVEHAVQAFAAPRGFLP